MLHVIHAPAAANDQLARIKQELHAVERRERPAGRAERAADLAQPDLVGPVPARSERVGGVQVAAADSGIDALTHAIEAFTAVDNEVFPLPEGERTVYQGKNPIADLYAEKAITLIGKFLRRAVADGHDLEAREGMALAATLAGLAFSNSGVAAVHAMEYPIGGALHCSHGAGNGLLLPFVMGFNFPVRVKEFAAIARMLGEEVGGENDQAAAERAMAAASVVVAPSRDDSTDSCHFFVAGQWEMGSPDRLTTTSAESITAWSTTPSAGFHANVSESVLGVRTRRTTS